MIYFSFLNLFLIKSSNNKKEINIHLEVIGFAYIFATKRSLIGFFGDNVILLLKIIL